MTGAARPHARRRVEREGKREPRQGRQQADRVECRGKKTPTLVSGGREALRRGSFVLDERISIRQSGHGRVKRP
jgi:hypothetical protein